MKNLSNVLWTIPGCEVSPEKTVGRLEPVDVLIDIDGPRLFTAVTPAGDELLVYHAAENEYELRRIAVTTDRAIVAKLRVGELVLCEALRRPWMWIVTQSFAGSILRVHRVAFEAIPAEVLPAEGIAPSR